MKAIHKEMERHKKNKSAQIVCGHVLSGLKGMIKSKAKERIPNKIIIICAFVIFFMVCLLLRLSFFSSSLSMNVIVISVLIPGLRFSFLASSFIFVKCLCTNIM